ncbi:MAG: hypothetical protein EXR69_15725 [Myxococcales bacterium]|nr:hypothetical protein [Myxococcales bacterium]
MPPTLSPPSVYPPLVLPPAPPRYPRWSAVIAESTSTKSAPCARNAMTPPVAPSQPDAVSVALTSVTLS